MLKPKVSFGKSSSHCLNQVLVKNFQIPRKNSIYNIFQEIYWLILKEVLCLLIQLATQTWYLILPLFSRLPLLIFKTALDHKQLCLPLETIYIQYLLSEIKLLSTKTPISQKSLILMFLKLQWRYCKWWLIKAI
jgi:hypothetical protein